MITKDKNGILDLVANAVPYYMLYEDTEQGKKIKYSQPIKPYHYLFSFSLIDERIQEVVTKVWVDDKKVMHRIAKWDESKIYLQGTDPFRVSSMFKEFVDKHLKYISNEKAEANQE